MRKRPFFSIVIPTYNRDEDLKLALRAILLQKYNDFEIVVSDNNSKDKTKDYVLGFRSDKIIYIRNDKNIGWIANLKQAIRLSKGKYLIFHGDDDFIIEPNALKNLEELILKKRWGVIRMNYVNRSTELNAIFSFHEFRLENIKLHENMDKTAVLNFLEAIDPFFLTGIVIKNRKNIQQEFIDSELAPWIKILFKNSSISGAIYLPKPYFVASWSQHAAQPFFNVISGKLRYENYLKWIKKELGEGKSRFFIVNRLNKNISLLPAVKFYNGQLVFLKYSKRMIELNKFFLYSYKFWFWFFVSLISPRFLLRKARIIFIKKFVNSSKNKNYYGIRNRIKKLEKQV